MVGTILTMVALAALIGIVELYAVAAGAVAGIGASWIWVARHRPLVQVRLTAASRPVPVSASLRATVEICNIRARTTPELVVQVPVWAPGPDGWSTALLRMAPLAPAAMARATVRVPTGHRGLVVLGPATASVRCPLGLVEHSASQAVAGADQSSPLAPSDLGRSALVAVHPRAGHVPKDALAALRAGAALPMTSTRAPSAVRALSGDPPPVEPWALREYRDGDDLRMVHWPTTARRGRLVVRDAGQAAPVRFAFVVDCFVAGSQPPPGPEGPPAHPYDAPFEEMLEMLVGLLTGGHLPTGSSWAMATTEGRTVSDDLAEALRVLALARPHSTPPVLALDHLRDARVVIASPNVVTGAELARLVTTRLGPGTPTTVVVPG